MSGGKTRKFDTLVKLFHAISRTICWPDYRTTY